MAEEAQIQQDKALVEAISLNLIFQKLPASKKLIQQISQEVLIQTLDVNRKIRLEEFQILLVLEGVVHQYVPNVWEGPSRSQELSSPKKGVILFKKLHKNDYCMRYHPVYMEDQSQLIAEAGSVVVKIPQWTFSKYFEKKLQHYIREVIVFLRQFEFSKCFRIELLYQLAKHVQDRTYPQGALLYERGQTGDYLHFIKSGNVELRQKRPSKKQKKGYVFNSVFGKGKVVGLDGIVTSQDTDKRAFTCQALTIVQTVAIQRRILLILLCSAKEKDGIKAYNELSLAEQFNNQARKLQVTFNRAKPRQGGVPKPRTQSVVDIMKQDPLPQFINTNYSPVRPQQKPTQDVNFQSSSSKFLTHTRLSVIRLGNYDNQEDQTPTPKKLFSQQRRSLTFLKSSSQSPCKYRRQYHKELEELVEVKKLKDQNTKCKFVYQTKMKQKMLSTTKIKRIFCSNRYKSQSRGLDNQQVLFNRLESLNQNPLLLNLESQRKRMINIVKKTLAR